MKSVAPEKYNTEYFLNILNYVNYSKTVTPSDFKFIHRHLTSVIQHNQKDFIVDYGCGNGDLSFLLALIYKCKILGIDYSVDAIKIAEKNKQLLKKTNSLKNDAVTFVCADNDHLPHLKNVTHIYLADVIEHLYDEEIDKIFRIFIQWNKHIKIIIHTDNNRYVNFVRPIVDLIAILLGKASFKSIKERNNWERERHVNLMNPQTLAKKLKKYHFSVNKVEYSPISADRIFTQLGNEKGFTLLIPFMLVLGKTFRFLLPSFYITLERKE